MIPTALQKVHMFEETNLIDDLVEEVRKHPGIVGGAVAVLAGIGFATLFLRQRTGPRRIEVIRERLSPRQWAEELGLGERLGAFGRRVREDTMDAAETSRERASDLGYDLRERASDFGHDIGDRARDLGDRARGLAEGARERLADWRYDRRRRHNRKKRMGSVRHAGESALDFASDHKREGAALLTVALIAAGIGAIALENRKLKGE